MKQSLNCRISLWIFCSLLLNTLLTTYIAATESPGMSMDMAKVIVAKQGGYVNVGPVIRSGFDLKAVLRSIMMQAEQEGMLDHLPTCIERCMMSLETSMYVHRVDLEEAMPYIMRACLPADMFDEHGNVMMDKAVRPNGEPVFAEATPGRQGELTDKAVRPGAEQGAPIVGAAGCDLSQVLQAISCLRALIVTDFNQTWTMIQNCCDEITREFEQTWTMIQNGINLMQQDFAGTWTLTQNGIDMLQSDFTQTWTMIQNCCNEISVDFEQTWTMIQNATNLMQSDFAGTWTLTQNGIDMLQSDFTQTWTMIQNCCDATSRDFEQTWTMIQNQQNLIQNDFSGTWTILANFELTVTTDLSEVFTMIQNCCNQTAIDFAGSWTLIQNSTNLMQNDFAGTWTYLSKIDQDVVNCCAQTQKDFTQTWTMIQNSTNLVQQDFNGTWTYLSKIDQDVVTCCGQTQKDFNYTWTILSDLSPCGATPLTQMDVDDFGTLTISIPGTYCLASDIAGTININANDVTLDLNGYVVEKITASSVQDIIIKNGFLFAPPPRSGMTRSASGLIALSGCTNVHVENVDFNGGPIGLSADSTVLLTVNNATIRGSTTSALRLSVTSSTFSDILIEGASTGSSLIDMSTSSGCVFTNVYANGNTAGNAWALSDVNQVIFTNCQANGTTINTTGNQIGTWVFSRCKDITLTNCQANENAFTNATTSPQICTGFLFESCSNISLYNCQASSNSAQAASSGNTSMYGMYLFNSNPDTNQVNTNILFKDCEASLNSTTGGSALSAAGFSLSDGNNIQYEGCLAHGNSSGTNAAAFGFSADTVSSDLSYTMCSAHSNNNAGIGNNSTAFSITGATRIIISGCTAQNNLGSGILLTSCANAIVERNISQFNIATGIGVAGFTTSTVLANQVSGSVTNYSVTAPVVTYTQLTGLFSAAPTPYDNISIV